MIDEKKINKGCSDIQILSGNGQQPTATYQTTQSTQNPSTQKPLVTTTKPPLTQQSTQRPVNNGKCTNGDGLYPNLGCKSFYQVDIYTQSLKFKIKFIVKQLCLLIVCKQWNCIPANLQFRLPKWTTF